MGGKIQGVVSNATNGEVFYSITDHYLKIDSQHINHDFKVNGQVEAEAKQGASKEVVGQHAAIKGKVQAGYGYKNDKNYTKFETQSQILVRSGQYKREGLQLQRSNKDERRFFTLWYNTKNQGRSIILINNLEITKESDIRQCVWIKGNEVICTPIAPEPKSFRLAPNNSEYRNYPPTRVCNKCSQSEKCLKDCPEYKQFGGFT